MGDKTIDLAALKTLGDQQIRALQTALAASNGTASSTTTASGSGSGTGSSTLGPGTTIVTGSGTAETIVIGQVPGGSSSESSVSPTSHLFV